MTVPIGRLEAELGADFSDFQGALAAMDKGLKAATVSVEALDDPVALLERRTVDLANAWRTGLISEGAYAQGLRQLKADIAETAAATSRSTSEMGRLAAIGGQVTGSLRTVSTQARRSVDGLEAIGVSVNAVALAATRGGAGISGALSSLQMVAMGNPTMIGILGGLAALAAAWATIQGRADDASESMQSAVEAARGMGMEGTRAHIIALSLQAAAMGPRVTTSRHEGEVISDPLRAQREALLEQVATLQNALDVLRNDPLRSSRRSGGADGGVMDLAGPDTTGIRLAIENTPQFLTAVEQQKAALRGLAEAMAAVGQRALQAFAVGGPGGAMESMGSALEQFKDFGKQIMDVSSFIADGLITVAASIGGGFKAIGGAILGVVGGFMVALGKAIIGTAIGVMALKNIVRANPLASIAAGVALVALGSALASSANRSAQSTFGGGGGGLASGAPALDSAGGARGNLTIVFPRDALIDPGNVHFQDTIAEIVRQAGARNVQFAQGG